MADVTVRASTIIPKKALSVKGLMRLDRDLGCTCGGKLRSADKSLFRHWTQESVAAPLPPDKKPSGDRTASQWLTICSLLADSDEIAAEPRQRVDVRYTNALPDGFEGPGVSLPIRHADHHSRILSHIPSNTVLDQGFA